MVSFDCAFRPGGTRIGPLTQRGACRVTRRRAQGAGRRDRLKEGPTHSTLKSLAGVALVAGPLLAMVAAAQAGKQDFSAFTDRTQYTGVLLQQGRVLLDDDFNEAESVEIPPGGVRGVFEYMFDPAQLQLALVPDGSGGRALGDGGRGAFVGDDSVTLWYAEAGPLHAFGLDFRYDATSAAFPADVFQVRIEDGADASTLFGNPEGLDPAGGTFFLGLIADPGFAFRHLTISSVTPRDDLGTPTFTVPPYTVDNLVFAPVPEPATLALLAFGGLVLAAARWRRHARR